MIHVIQSTPFVRFIPPSLYIGLCIRLTEFFVRRYSLVHRNATMDLPCVHRHYLPMPPAGCPPSETYPCHTYRHSILFPFPVALSLPPSLSLPVSLSSISSLVLHAYSLFLSSLPPFPLSVSSFPFSPLPDDYPYLSRLLCTNLFVFHPCSCSRLPWSFCSNNVS